MNRWRTSPSPSFFFHFIAFIPWGFLRQRNSTFYDGDWQSPDLRTGSSLSRKNRANLWQTRVIFNVANPTLTVFRPEAGTGNGTALVICPGGAFWFLAVLSGMPKTKMGTWVSVLPIPKGLNHLAQGCDPPRRSVAKVGERATLGDNKEESQPCRG